MRLMIIDYRNLGSHDIPVGLTHTDPWEGAKGLSRLSKPCVALVDVEEREGVL